MIGHFFSSWTRSIFLFSPATSPAIAIPSSSTYSTEFSLPSFVLLFSVRSPNSFGHHHPGLAGRVYATHEPVYSDGSPTTCRFFGPFPLSLPLHPVSAHSNYGTSHPYGSFRFSPEELSIVLWRYITLTYPALLRVQVTPDSRTHRKSANLCAHLVRQAP